MSVQLSGGMNAILLCFLIMFCLLNMLLLYKFWTLEQQVVNKIDLYDRYRIDEITGLLSFHSVGILHKTMIITHRR